MANKINFNAKGAPTRPLKGAPSKYRLSPGRPNISQSDGVRPAFPLLPFKHLPESFQDINTEDWVVIPKGRIVSAITSNDAPEGVIGDGTDYYGVAKGIMGLMVPANGGTARTVTSPSDAADYVMPANKPIGVSEHDVYQDIRGENLNYDMRNKNYGVLSRQLIKLPAVDTYTFDTFMGQAGLFVPAVAGAEGGAEDLDGSYTAALDLSDATATPVTVAFATYAAAHAGATFSSLGVVTYDGADLTLVTDYSVDAAGDITFSTDQGTGTESVVINFVYDLANVGSVAPGSTTDISDTGYKSVEKEYSFYTFNSEASQGTAGSFLKSGYYGNFMPHTTDDAQCVGRLMGVDYRFGKDLLDTVQTVYEDNAGYRVAGTGTKGVPQFLYNFAYNAISAALEAESSTWESKWPGADPAEKILEFCEGGAIGEAWIQLDV